MLIFFGYPSKKCPRKCGGPRNYVIRRQAQSFLFKKAAKILGLIGLSRNSKLMRGPKKSIIASQGKRLIALGNSFVLNHL